MVLRRFACTALGLAFASTTLAAAPDTRALSAAIDRAHVAGFDGVVLFGDTATVLLERAVGLADRERARPHRVDERWLWASTTKQVTAVLVMQEVDRGNLTLDQTLRSALPAFKGARADAITIRQLLQHTSGLPNPDATPQSADGVPAFYRQRGHTIDDTPRALGYCAGPTSATPPDGFAYNNCDYLVLGAILERVTRRKYAGLVNERIARPIGARSLRVALDGAANGGADAIGYADRTTRSPAINVATFGAAGALVGTARDLLAFDRALMTRRLLTPASTATMWTGDPKLGHQALGAWAFPATLAGCDAPVRLVERRGAVGGTQVRNVIAPDLGLALVVFTNDASVDFGEIWQGKGLSHVLLSAAFCPAPR